MSGIKKTGLQQRLSLLSICFLYDQTQTEDGQTQAGSWGLTVTEDAATLCTVLYTFCVNCVHNAGLLNTDIFGT